ncbi:MAG: hypothetical protein WED10_06150 [Brumimicrobium sp.]
MIPKLHILLTYFVSLFIGVNSVNAQQILTPLGSSFKDKLILSEDSESKHALGSGFFPNTYSESGYRLPGKDTTQGWIRRKLFNEHFIQIEGDDYFLAIDPLLNLTLGEEFLQNNTERVFQNTRGVQAFGEVLDKVSFYTVFYENQARFANFQNQHFLDRGEQRLKNGVYQTSNAMIPGGGRTKPFKSTGFDYASSASYIRYQPFKKLAVQFGNTPQFIGWGHRSFLISDNSFNFSNLKIDWKISPKINYTLIRGKQLNLFRRAVTNQVEAPFERKYFGTHYLTFNPISNLTIGFFEASMYLKDEAVTSRSLDPMFYQPIIGLNTAASGWENENIKNLIGLNFGLKIAQSNLLYGQLVTDDLENIEYGAQIGWRSSDLFGVKNLFINCEFNFATNRLFSAENRRMSYTNYNLPLAHTLGNGFEELVTRAGYEWKKIYVFGSSVNYRSDQSMRDKSALFESKEATINFNETIVSNNSFEFGYILNHATRLSVFAKGLYRISSTSLEGDLNNGILMFGIKTGIRNQYMDF